jgi:hypothetical protein
MEDVAVHASRYVSPAKDAFTDRVDQRALDLWERNLKLIAELCRTQGVRPIFVPQIMNWQALVSDKPDAWFPYVRDRDVKKIMAAYHTSMESVAKEEGITYVGEVLDVPFSSADFMDIGHFSPEGNRRFARLLAERIKGR